VGEIEDDPDGPPGDPISRDPIGVLATAPVRRRRIVVVDVIEENPRPARYSPRWPMRWPRCARSRLCSGPRGRARSPYAHRDRKAAKSASGPVRRRVRRWHVPALDRAPQPRADRDLLKGPAEGKDQGDLGAVDCAAAGARQRLWRGRGGARLVRASVGDARRRRSRARLAGKIALVLRERGISSRPPR
jgi:hypothetical protein